MGNDELKVTSMQPSELRENLQQSYNVVRGIPDEPSIWENFSPMALGSSIAFPLIFSCKEFSSVKMDPSLSGIDLKSNKYRMVRLNELNAHVNRLNVRDPFLQSDVLSLKDEIKSIQGNGALAKDKLKALNKKYYEIVSKNTNWKTGFITKALAKGATKSSFCGELLKSYKSNKIMILFEALQEAPTVIQAFGESSEKGMKQLAKSTGRAAVGFGGFVAGTAAGAKIGALLGSVIPGAGTLVGGLLGSAIGFAIGGLTSQLSKMAYDKVIPSENEITKENKIETIISEQDTTPEAKQNLEEEIAYCNNYLYEAGAILEAAINEGDTETQEATREQMTAILNVLNQLKTVYQKKFGEAVVSELNNEAKQEKTEQIAQNGSNTQTTTDTQAATNTQTSNITMQTNPMFNPYNPTGFIGNEFMNYTPQIDWSAMLPANVSNKMFGIA